MRDTIDMAREAGWWTLSRILRVRLERFAALVRADERSVEREKFKHNEEVLMNALWKACGDDGQLVVETIASQGELK